jgi:hypothetical protein
MKYSWDFEGGVDMVVEEIVAKAASLGGKRPCGGDRRGTAYMAEKRT